MEIAEMKDRIAHIIRAKNLTAAEFAVRLGIQPSNISHLLSGRNNPSLDFVKKLKETFPEYSTDWIIFGTGPMTISEPMATVAPAQPVSAPSMEKENTVQFEAGTLFDSEQDAAAQVNSFSPLEKSTVKEIIVVYSDNTFEQLLPR